MTSLVWGDDDGSTRDEREISERRDEEAREQDFRLAEAFALGQLREYAQKRVPYSYDAPAAERQLDAVADVLRHTATNISDHAMLAVFALEYGTPALLRVLATALEQTH